MSFFDDSPVDGFNNSPVYGSDDSLKDGPPVNDSVVYPPVDVLLLVLQLM